MGLKCNKRLVLNGLETLACHLPLFTQRLLPHASLSGILTAYQHSITHLALRESILLLE